jgi:hypothetical protein
MFDIVIPHLTLVLASTQAQGDDLLQEARNYRLSKKFKPKQLGLGERLLLSLGDLMISFGLWLRARYQPNSTVSIPQASLKI